MAKTSDRPDHPDHLTMPALLIMLTILTQFYGQRCMERSVEVILARDPP